MKEKVSFKAWEKILFLYVWGIVCVIIFKGTSYVFHSDDATVLLLAKEQIIQRKLLPDGWNHGTAIWTVGLQTFIIPFMLFVDDWILCRQLAVIVQLFFSIYFMFLLLKQMKVQNKFLVLTIALLPISEEVLEHCFFQATYMTNQLIIFSILVVSFKVLCKETTTKKDYILWGTFTILVTIIGCHNTLISLATSALPLALGIIAYSFIGLVIEGKKVEKKNIIVLISLALGMFFAVMIYAILISKLGFAMESTGATEFLGTGGYGRMIETILDEFLLLYGAVGQCGLFSVEGILRTIRFIYFIICGIIIPICLIVKYNKMAHPVKKIFCLYSWISAFIIIYISMVTGKCSARYFTMIYFNNIILLGIFLDTFDLKNVILKKISIFSCYVLCFCVSMFYVQYNYQENPNNIGMWRCGMETYSEELLKKLQEEEVGLIYANYSIACSSMAASNGEIIGIAYEAYEPLKFKAWLNSSNWFDKNYYSGKVAIVYRIENDVNEIYVKLASKSIQVGEYHVLIFDKNLLEYQELAEVRKSILAKEKQTQWVYKGKNLVCEKNATIVGEEIHIPTNGIQRGPYLTLKEGRYLVCINGYRLEKADVLTIRDGKKSKESLIPQNIIKSDKAITYEFELEKLTTGIEFYLKNETLDEMVINEITIRKEE